MQLTPSFEKKNNKKRVTLDQFACACVEHKKMSTLMSAENKIVVLRCIFLDA